MFSRFGTVAEMVSPADAVPVRDRLESREEFFRRFRGRAAFKKILHEHRELVGEGAIHERVHIAESLLIALAKSRIDYGVREQRAVNRVLNAVVQGHRFETVRAEKVLGLNAAASGLREECMVSCGNYVDANSVIRFASKRRKYGAKLR